MQINQNKIATEKSVFEVCNHSTMKVYIPQYIGLHVLCYYTEKWEETV